MQSSRHRGHSIVYEGSDWVYSDTGEPVAGTERPCGHCGRERTAEGHDGCIGILSGVMNACCGHGNADEAYQQFWDGECIRGEKARRAFSLNEEAST